jgi:hypothetical protein
MDNRDEITKEWFQPETVVVEVLASELQGWLDDRTIANLSGAPKNSKVIVSLLDEAIELRVQNPQILAEDMVRLIYQNEDGFKFHVQNAVFVLSDKLRNLGLGARSFALEATTAAQEGLFDKIVTSAIGSFATLSPDNTQNQYSGYYTWARVGFDAPLPPEVLSQCTGELANVTRLFKLMRTEAGREIWAEFGSSTDMEFDLAKDSACWETLRSYMMEKGIKVLP